MVGKNRRENNKSPPRSRTIRSNQRRKPPHFLFRNSLATRAPPSIQQPTKPAEELKPGSGRLNCRFRDVTDFSSRDFLMLSRGVSTHALGDDRHRYPRFIQQIVAGNAPQDRPPVAEIVVSDMTVGLLFLPPVCLPSQFSQSGGRGNRSHTNSCTT